MIHQLLTTEYFFWLVVLSFYLLDSFKLLTKSQILVTETISGKFRPTFIFNPLEIEGKQVHGLNLMIPFTGFLKLDTKPNQDPSTNFEKTHEDLVSFQDAASPFKVLSMTSFVCLLFGPILTFYRGLEAALLFLLPIHFIILFTSLILLLISRKRLGFTYSTSFSIFFNCLLVPGHLPNIVRMIYSKKIFNCDGYYFSLRNCEEKDLEELKYNISRKIDRTIERIDESELPDYYSYKESLGITNDKQ